MATLPHPPLKVWTRAELEALEATGVLADSRYELIEGEVFDKMGQNPRHASAIAALQYLLAAIFGVGRLRIQLPVEPFAGDAPNTLPVPDLAVSRDEYTTYRTRHPGSGDVLLIVEVADTTVLFDTKRKARLYARAGFPEYIVVDLTRRELTVYREPREGSYQAVTVLRPGDDFIPLAEPAARVPVNSIVGA